MSLIKRIFLFSFFVFFSLFSDEIDDALNFLYSNQSTDGSWGNTAPNKFLYTTEVLKTLKMFSDTTVYFQNGVQWLINHFPDDIDFISRKLSILAMENEDIEVLKNKVLSWQNENGGFGYKDGYESNLYYTISAIEGLSSAGDMDSSTIKGLNYIIINQNPDGSFSFKDDGVNSIFVTALSLSTLSNFRGNISVENAINTGVSYLGSQMNPDSGYGEDGSSIYETALVLQSLFDVNKRPDIRTILKDYIWVRQLPDGSWNEDIYETALALRVLQKSTLPDLSLESLELNPTNINQGDTVSVITRIANIGDSDAQNVNLRLYDDGQGIKDTLCNEVLSGDTAEVEILWNTGETVGYRTIGVRIDPDNEIDELSKENNYQEKMVYIQDTVPPESLDIYVQNPYFSPNSDGIKDISSVYFSASEDVIVALNITDKNGNTVKELLRDESYSQGTYSVEWDGSDSSMNILRDGDYVYNVSLTDNGGNTEIRHHFVVIDNNKTPIFESLEPNRIYMDRVMGDDPENTRELLKYYPEYDLCFLGFKNEFTQGYLDIVLSNGLRTYLDILCEFWVGPYYHGNADLQYSDPYNKIFFNVRNRESPLYSFDLSNEELDSIRDDVVRYQISPNYNKIICESYSGLFLTDFDGSYFTHIGSHAGIMEGSWSPDGNLFVYYDADSSAIFLADQALLNTKKIFECTFFDAFPDAFAWSEDGSRFAFTQVLEGDSVPIAGILISDRMGSYLDTVATFLIYGPHPPLKKRVLRGKGMGIFEGLKWHPDGNAILISISRVGWKRKDGVQDKKGLYEIDLESDTVKLLYEWPGGYSDMREFQYAYKGSLILYRKHKELYCMDRNGDNRILVSALPTFNWYGKTYLSENETFFLWEEEYTGINLDNLTTRLRLQRLLGTPNQLTISGIVCDRGLEYYTLSYGEGKDPSVYQTFYSNSNTVLDTIITNWIPPHSGNWTIRLQASDRAGNLSEAKEFICWEGDALLTNLYAEPECFSPGSEDVVDSTVISYTILKAEPVFFNIVDLAENSVFFKYMEHPIPGEYSFIWDGKDYSGDIVKNGKYFVKACGYSTPLYVDTIPPDVFIDLSFDPDNFVRNGYYDIRIDGMVYDLNFKGYTLYFTFEDTNQFLPVLSGARPIPDTTFLIGFIGLEDLGTYYAKFVAEDYVGHQETVIDSIFIDSFYVNGEIGEEEEDYIFYSEARIFLPEVDSIVFSVQFGRIVFGADSLVWTRHVRQGRGILLEENFYYCNDSVEIPHFGSDEILYAILFQGDVWYGDSNHRVACDIDTIPFHKEEGRGLLITNPLHSFPGSPPPVVSKIYTVEADYFARDSVGNLLPHPEFLEWVKFQYAPLEDTSWFTNIGIKDDSLPFQQPWNTYLLPNGFYRLKATGIDTLGSLDTLHDRIDVEVLNNPITLLLQTRDSYLHLTDTIYAQVLADTIFHGTIQSVKFSYILSLDTTLISEDFESPYQVPFNTQLLPDTQITLIGYTCDDIGNDAWSQPLRVTIDNTLPIAEISYPTNGMSFDNPDTIPVLGTASDMNLKNTEINLGSMAITKDHSIFSDTLTLFDTRTLQTGDYEISVIVEDKVNNISADTVVITITNSPIPDVSILKPDSNSFQNDTMEIVYSVTDDNLSYYVLKYGIGENPNYTVIDSNTSSGQNKQYILNTSGLQDTLYSLVLYAKDLTDKENSDTLLFTVDNTNPFVSIIYPEEYQRLKDKFPVIGSVLDRNLYQDTLFVGTGENPSVWTEIKSSDSPFDNDTILVWNPFMDSDVYTFRLSAVDKAGNISEDSVTIFLDTIPPAPPEGITAVDSIGIVDLSWLPNTEDDLNGYNLFRQGTKIHQESLTDTFFVDTLPAVEGIYKYYLTAVDILDNESESSDTISVEVDLSAPYAKIISPDNNQWIKGIDTVMGTITDKNLLEYNLEYAPISDTNYTLLVTGLSEIPYGEIYKWDVSGLSEDYNLRLRAVDTYNNRDTFEIIVRVDNTPPLLPDSLTAIPQGSQVDCSWLPATDEHLYGYYLYRSGEEVNTFIIPDTFYVDTVPDGEFFYTVVASDSAGNLSEPAGPESVIVDTRAPSVVITHPSEGSTVNGVIDIVTMCEDYDLSSVVFKYKEESGPWDTIGMIPLPPFVIQFNTDTLSDGKYYLSAVGTDIFGNTDNSPDSIFIFKKTDLTPPEPPQGLICNTSPLLNGGRVDLYWERNLEDDLDNYNIYRDTIKITSVSDTFFTEDISVNEYIIYNVSAVDTASNESSLSDSVIADLVPPELIIHGPEESCTYSRIIPITVTVNDKSLSLYQIHYVLSTDTTLLYQDSLNVVEGTVYRWNTGDLNDTVVLILTGSDVNGFSDTASNEFIVDNLPPPPPESLTAVLNPDTSITLNWLPVTTESVFYNIYYSTVSGTGYAKLNTEPVLNESYQTRLPGGKTYYFVATAVDEVENESGYSNEASISPPVDDIDIVVGDGDIWNFPSSPVVGDSVFTVVKVHNTGSHPAENFSLRLMVKHNDNYFTLNEWIVNNLLPDSLQEFSFNWATDGLAGFDTLYLLADPEDYIRETDESNNIYTLPIEIRETDILFSYSLSDSVIPPFTDLTAYYSITNTDANQKDLILSFSILDSDSTVISRDFDIEHLIIDSMPAESTYGDFFYDTTNARFGSISITDSGGPGEHSFGFSSDSIIMELSANQCIVQYVYLDSINPPSEIMMEFEDRYGNRAHRAFYGSDLINRGISGTSSRRKLGDLPEKGKWVRLLIPLDSVGIYDGAIKGIEFLHYNGNIFWDGTGITGNEVSFSLSQGEIEDIEILWNSDVFPGGGYSIISSLETGSSQIERAMQFEIMDIPGMTTYVYTDKPNYDSYENVYITAVAINNSPNHTYNDLKEFITIVDSIDVVYFMDSTIIPVMLPGSEEERQFVHCTESSHPGMYYIKECIVSDSDTLTTTENQFYVNPSWGEDIMVAGRISSTPKLIPYPDSFTISYYLLNIGNLPIDSLPFSIKIVQMEDDTTLYTLWDTVSLNVSDSTEGDYHFSSSSFELKPYALFLKIHPEDTTLDVALSGFLVSDLTSPIVEILAPSGFVNGNVTVLTNGIDEASGIDSLYFSIDTINVRMNLISGDSLDGQYSGNFDSRGLPDGEFNLNVLGVDYYGNSSLDSTSIRIDNTIPEITISGVLDSSYYNCDLNIVVGFFDEHLCTTIVKLNDENVSESLFVSEEGRYLLFASAEDSAGNQLDSTIFFVIDKTPPLIIISGVSDSSFYNHSIFPSFTVADSNPDTTYATLNGNPFESGTMIEEEGDYELNVYSSDLAGNFSSESLYFVIDTTSPTPPLIISPEDYDTIPLDTVTITGLGEGNSEIHLFRDSISLSDVADDSGYFDFQGVSLSSGLNLFRFISIDLAGNVSDTTYHHLYHITTEFTCSTEITPIARVLSITDDSLFIEDILNSMDTYYRIVNKKDDFEREFRSGKYNIYLISGDHPYIDPLIQNEMREAVFRGDGLVMLTSSPCQPVPHLYEPFGICVFGHLPECNYNAFFDSSAISDYDTLELNGKVLRIVLNGGEEIARFKKRGREQGWGSITLKGWVNFRKDREYEVDIIVSSGLNLNDSIVSEQFKVSNTGEGFEIKEGTEVAPPSPSSHTDSIWDIRIDSITNKFIEFTVTSSQIMDDYYTFLLKINDEKIGPVPIPLKKNEVLEKGMSFGGFTIERIESLCCEHPAVVQNQYGKGKTFFFGFKPQQTDETQKIKEKIKMAVLNVVPDTDEVYIYNVVSPIVSLFTPEPLQDVEVKERIPEGFESIAVLDSGEITMDGFRWIRDISDSLILRSVVRLPKEPFTDSILITVNNKDSLFIPLEAEKDVYEMINDVIFFLDTLNLSGADDTRRNLAIRLLKRVYNEEINKKKDLVWNIRFSITAAYLVGEIESIDCSSYRREIDRTIRIWEVKWFKW
ncbi:hypothetical protein KAW18_08315 [candidate division WOR-3 bacterium]|nr:hypothetical protein [candidate division WOR-3 bacterium]